MTLDDTTRLLQSVGGLPVGPPPINNSCLPTLYDKLDADARRKTRVMNGLLDFRLKVHNKIIDKYKKDAKKVYIREKEQLQNELKKTTRKLPYIKDIPYLKLKIPMPNKIDNDLLFRGHVTQPKPLKGITSERDDKPFCDRFFSHHIPSSSRFPKPLVTASLQSIQLNEEEEMSKARKLKFSKHMSMSENCLSAGVSFERSILLSKETTAVPEDDAVTI